MRDSIALDAYVPYSLVFATLLPTFIMVVCYTRMILALAQSAKNTKMTKSKSGAHDPNVAQVDKLRMAQMNIFQTCLITLVFFIACWLSKDTALFLYHTDVYSHLNNYHYAIGRLMIIVNSGLNPYIYAARYKEYQQQVLYLLGMRDKRAGSTVTGMSMTAVSAIA